MMARSKQFHDSVQCFNRRGEIARVLVFGKIGRVAFSRRFSPL